MLGTGGIIICGRVVASLKEARRAHTSIRVSSFLNRPVRPARLTPQAFCEYWISPLLRDRREIIEEIVFLEHPIRMVAIAKAAR